MDGQVDLSDYVVLFMLATGSAYVAELVPKSLQR